MEAVCLIQTDPGDQGFTNVSVYQDILETNARLTLTIADLIHVHEVAASMVSIITHAFVILDMSEGTVTETLMTAALLLVITEIAPTTQMHTVAHVIPVTVDRIALLTLMNASHPLAEMEYVSIKQTIIDVNARLVSSDMIVTWRLMSACLLLAFTGRAWTRLIAFPATAMLVSLEKDARWTSTTVSFHPVHMGHALT